MKILDRVGREDLAWVYLAQTDEGKYLEFVESLTPPLSREEKWVFIITTIFGCPVRCKMCDAGGTYRGKLTKEEMFAQIDYMVTRRFPDRVVRTKKWKIHFCRMGEPTFNPAVLEVMEELPRRYKAPIKPSISTIAPKGCDAFLTRLKEIKDKLYGRNFQLQFSIHTTNVAQRNWLIPVKKWSFEKIGEFGEYFFEPGDGKITLNFALEERAELDVRVLEKYFSPEIFLIKITPLNPTVRGSEEGLKSKIIASEEEARELVEPLQKAGYDVIVSIGELDENQVGSNCGQFVKSYLERPKEGMYRYAQPMLAKKKE